MKRFLLPVLLAACGIASAQTATTTAVTNANGTITLTTLLTPASAVLSAPTITDFTATPAVIAPGGHSTLTFTASPGAVLSLTGCSCSPESGMVVLPTQTTTYTLTASNAAGSTQAIATVSVEAAPPTDTTIANIQAKDGWSIVTGPSIGPVAPSIFKFQQGVSGDAMLISVTGVPGKYADGMLKFSYPLPANTGNAKMNNTFTLDSDSLTNTQALEMGTKITDANGITYNGQIQFDYSTSATDMVLDVVNKSYGWTSTGVKLPKFTAGVNHTVDVTYSFDTAAKTSSVVSVEVDGTLYTTPTDLLNLPGQALGWAKSELLAGFQPDVNTKGGSFTWTDAETDWVIW